MDGSGFSEDERIGEKVGGDQVGGYGSVLMQGDDTLEEGDTVNKVRRDQILAIVCCKTNRV